MVSKPLGPVASSLKVWRPWQRKQFELFQGRALTNTSTSHHFQHYMIVALQSGAGWLQYRNTGESVHGIDGAFYVLEPGETWLCQSNGASFSSLCIDPAWLQWIAAELTQKERPQPHFPGHSLFDRSLNRALRELAASSQTPVSRLHQEELLLTFAQILLAHAEDPGTSLREGREHAAVKRIKEYLQAYYTEEVTLQKLAQVTNLSPFHLIRVFRQTVGLSPHAYQTQLRLECARTLLGQGYDLSYVAHETGFFDQSHFTQQFKRSFSITPGSYRKGARCSSSASLSANSSRQGAFPH